MKKFYIIFFTSFTILSFLLYLSIWWFLGGAAIIALSVSYHFYNTRLKNYIVAAGDLELQVEELQKQLDRSLLKEERATIEARQIGQMKQDLLTTLNHEIRTPMNGVLGMSLLLADTALTEEQNGYIDIIKNSGQSLLETVNAILVKDILEYSKIDRGDKKLQNIDFNLRDTIEEVVSMFAIRAAKAGIEFACDINENAPLQLSGDNKRLREILLNLIDNAIKFTHRGEVLVRVQSLNKDSDKPTFSFEIEDTGTGITEEQMKQLFYAAPVRGFANGNKKSGHGLVICRKHATLMGGKIEVKNKAGAGTIFTFTVSFPHSLVSQVHREPVNLKNLEGKYVLVVDDNITSRNIILKQLKAWKMNTAWADSGIQALEILADNKKIDLVLTDLYMPQMDGFQFARVVQKSYPNLKIILLNPAGFDTYKQEQNLFAAVLSKPLRQHIFRDSLLALFAQPGTENTNKSTEMENDFSKKYPLRILIAEDNLINQKIAIKILNKLGYQPKLANNGREALEMSTSDQTDIILMDVQMPEMDGLEATKMIRGNPGIQPVIIAMTANVLQGDRDACLQAGMDDYVSKPINLIELLQQLEKWSLVISQRA